MKILVIARHGEYGREDLDEDGVAQMERLAKKLKERAAGKKTVILSSTAPRASQSARIMSDTLGVPVEEHDVLWADNWHRQDNNGAMDLINGKDEYEIVIVVTHLEYTEDLPNLAGFRFGIDIPRREASKGCAWVIDCERSRCDYLTHYD